MSQVKIRRALFSVSDKEGAVGFARFLAQRGVEILATGGTAKKLGESGVPYTPMEKVTGNPEAGKAKVSIDGQDQNVEGTVVCTAMGGNVQIAIGNATTGIGAQVSEGDSPTVHQVGLGNVNGVALGFQEGAPGGEATAKIGRAHV